MLVNMGNKYPDIETGIWSILLFKNPVPFIRIPQPPMKQSRDKGLYDVNDWDSHRC